MKEFQFNEHDVCLNPNSYHLLDKNYNILTVTTAVCISGWVFGLRVHGNDWGMSSGCWYNGETFHTEKAAFYAALEVAKQQKLNIEHIKAIENQQFFPEYQQLELF